MGKVGRCDAKRLTWQNAEVAWPLLQPGSIATIRTRTVEQGTKYHSDSVIQATRLHIHFFVWWNPPPRGHATGTLWVRVGSSIPTYTLLITSKAHRYHTLSSLQSCKRFHKLFPATPHSRTSRRQS